MSTSAITQATFTLTAPKGMSVLTPAVESANSLAFGTYAKVMPSAPVVAMGASGTTTAEPDIQLNDVWSRGPVTLKDRDKILGVLHAKTLSPADFPLTQPQDKAPVFDPVSKLTWTVTYPTTTPVNVIVDPPNKMSVDPGVFGSITLNPVRLGGQGAELTLKSGTYYVGSLTLDSYSKVWLDQSKGPVIIYASKVVGFRATFASLDGTPPDLFVGYFGTDPIYIETQFNGAIVAPNALMTLRTVTGGHTGFFAGKNVTLDSNAIVNYRVPNLITTVAKVPQSQCKDLVQKRTDLTGDAQQAAYIADLARYCGFCLIPTDSDLDKTPDCLDGCPYDKDKTAPGVAGCGVADPPDEGDKVPPGPDRCNQDPRNISAGDCGCVGQTTLQPAGTPCGDPPCPGQLAPVCDGAGKCGNVAACQPASDCVQVSDQGDNYFVCGGTVPGGTGTITPKTWDNAVQTCKSKGLVLARVDTYAQDQLIRALLKSYNITQAWLGGNQLSVAGAWRWATASNNNGDQFWSGGANGSRVGGRFAFWSSGRPSTTGKCLAIQSSDGRWVDGNCTQPLPYVCQNPQVGRTWDPPGPSIPVQPVPPLNSTPGICVPEFADGGGLLPAEDELDVLEAQHAAAHADPHTYTGAAANPPPPNTPCTISRAAENCPLSNIKSPTREGCGADCECIDKDECIAQFGSGYVCLPVLEVTDPPCVPDADAGVTCGARSRCGIPTCVELPHWGTRCNEVDICPTAEEAEYTPVMDPDETSMGPVDVDPNNFFPPDKKPNTTPSPSYSDPPIPGGTNHSWCKLDAQATDKVQSAAKDGLNRQGQSGKGSKLQFNFKPELIFEAHPKPLAFGESDFSLRAVAGLTAHAALKNFLKMDWDKDILYAKVGIQANRCRVSTEETAFKIMGVDFMSLLDFVPQIDTDADGDGAKAAATDCSVALASFLRSADRAKKSFRDAQQLLLQYKKAQVDGKAFSTELCKDLGIADMFNDTFPGGALCPGNEQPEATINRFIDFYQDGIAGQAAAIGPAASALTGASQALRQKVATVLRADDTSSPQIHAPFVNFKRSETKTIIKANFMIGPVPMVIEIAATAAYGLRGGFDLDLSLPTSLGGSRGDLSASGSPVVEQLARASVGVEPWASAGLTLFVGCDIGIASVGIEGGVTLAKISAPINAGVGVALASTPDTRQAPDDIKKVAVMDGTVPRFLFQPTSYQFFLTYDVGAKVSVTDILAGEVNGRLTIDFWLFSRTWRKRIVKFKGLYDQEFPLIAAQGNTKLVPFKGGSNVLTASANSAMGIAEGQLPFVWLERLSVPAGPQPSRMPGAGGTSGAAGATSAPPVATVDKTSVEKFLYDDLCCLREGSTCNPADRLGCCEPLQCSSGTCQKKPGPTCAADGAKCGWDEKSGVDVECCSGNACPASGVCPMACVPIGGDCKPKGSECCTNLSPDVYCHCGSSASDPCTCGFDIEIG